MARTHPNMVLGNASEAIRLGNLPHAQLEAHSMKAMALNVFEEVWTMLGRARCHIRDGALCL
eukprot:2904046-Prymnesium_polylepis.1